MASTRVPTRPIIVCGAARSATTFLGELLKTSVDVEILPELDPLNTPSMFGLLDELRGTLQWQKWKEYTEEDVDGRVVEVLRQIWRAGRRLHFRDLDRPRFGLKQPWAENLQQEFRDALGQFRPQWVYAIRDPVRVYGSNLRMAGAPDWSPEAFRERYEASLHNALTLLELGDLFLIDVEAIAADEARRRQTVADLFAFLEIKPGAWTSWFTDRWSKVNEGTTETRGQRPEAEVDSRIAALLEPDSFRAASGWLEELRAAAKQQADLAPAPIPAAEPLPDVAPDAPPSTRFWNQHYAEARTSGLQPYGHLDRFKAEVVTRLLDEHQITSVIELGVGDGVQLSQIEYPAYLGLDVAPVAIRFCEWIFEGDASKRFRVSRTDEVLLDRADLTISLDVIYRLTEDRSFEVYMRNLFNCATRLVIIYSSNEDVPSERPEDRHRIFTDWVKRQASDWRLLEGIIPPRYPYDPDDPNTSRSEFFVYVPAGDE